MGKCYHCIVQKLCSERNYNPHANVFKMGITRKDENLWARLEGIDARRWETVQTSGNDWEKLKKKK